MEEPPSALVSHSRTFSRLLPLLPPSLWQHPLHQGGGMMGYRAGISPLDVIILGGIAYTGEGKPYKPSLPPFLPPFRSFLSLVLSPFFPSPPLPPLLPRSLQHHQEPGGRQPVGRP